MFLHADLDAFYASVEQRDHPSLRGRPVIVGGGVVLAASYEARDRGVKTAMGSRQARRLCPDAAFVEPRMSAYSAASKAVFEIFADTTPMVEGLSIDEAFLDVSGLARVSGRPDEIAERLRGRVRDEVGLAITVGIARTKFLAKVASAVGKPDGLLVVPLGGEDEFLHPLPVERLWGVGPVTAKKLRNNGIFTVGEIAAIPENALVATLGKASGHHLFALAHNRDPRPIVVGRRRGSIGSQRALGRSDPSLGEIEVMLSGLVDRIGRRLRRANRVGRTVVVRFRYGDFSRATRSHTLTEATADTALILDTTRVLLRASADVIDEKHLTLIGVSVAQLTNADAVQLSLPLGQRNRPSVHETLDEIAEKFPGVNIGRASGLSGSSQMAVPLLPD
ncbi:MAG: DNA polymerase IV [Acidobacteria bacterium]|nr:DNA polymerase IV [Acidobacteriota bacterium]